MKLIAIEGNIGSGKSTFIPELAKELGFEQIQEPVDDPEFTRLLQAFYDNPTNTSVRLDFQRYITETRAKLLSGIPDGNYLIERSLYSDLIFSQVNMLSTERPDGSYISYYYDIIDRLRDYPQVDAVVYLRTSPEVTYKRMVGRGRKAEAHTPLEYIEDVHRYHEAALPQICREYNTELLTFDWDKFGSPRLIAAQLEERGII